MKLVMIFRYFNKNEKNRIGDLNIHSNVIHLSPKAQNK